ncbi:hypothetical protein M153_7010003966 [Pseudoloma neurophilia]|uniref:Uncharacterized protein n=1 Tax=Pseudoloma neurophilia TaxID=146866 RepID=A0A0R0LWT9_9MICR|nr:hypothetical protein M153_7010003966 [Pseudoloma neurophilia]
MPSNEKIKLTNSQLTEVLQQLETQLLPLDQVKVKLLKTLQKILMANIQIIEDENEVELNEQMAIRTNLMNKLACLRRDGPKETASQYFDLLDQTVNTVSDSLNDNYTENIIKNEKEDKTFNLSQENDHFSKIRELNDTIPEKLDKFRNAIEIINELTESNKGSAEDKALLYFYKNGYSIE